MKRVLITILDGIGETSMPYNEFVLWRAKHCINEKQILVIIGNKQKVYDNNYAGRLEIIQTERNFIKVRRRLNALIRKLKSDGVEFAIHLHQLKSASIAQLSMIGTGFRKKTVFTIHSTFTGYALHNKIQSYFNGIMARYVICVSDASYTKYPSSLKRIKGDRVMAIRNGVDIDRINDVVTISKRRKDDDYVRFIYVARLIPLKNHIFLMKVIKKVSHKVQFVFVGRDGDSDIMNMIKNANMGERVVLTGQIPREEVFDLLNSSDAYISSSTLEGMPISVLEAMYCGLPAILSDIPQHKEIGGETDFVCYLPCDVDKWVQVINEIVELSPEERERKGIESKKYVKENFSLHVMHQNYDKLYKVLRQC